MQLSPLPLEMYATPSLSPLSSSVEVCFLQEHPSPRVPVHEEERDEPPKTIEIVASVPGMASDRSSTSLITSTSGTSHMLKMERSEAEW
mmetsp:Transcript_4822/g.13423  ORF Transcript_4822/g.13423 Transcript_4822/m.13423 type:complete len:89 (+) Transcript_4822:583-849(+)